MPWHKQFDVDATLDVAMEAFWDRGFEATSMQNVVDCTGVNRASLYATYGDKHTLFLAALRRYAAGVGRQIAEIEERVPPGPAAIEALFRLFAHDDPCGRGRRKAGRRGCFLTNTALELAPHDREAGRVVARGQEQMEAFFVRMVEAGQAAGTIPQPLDARAAARGLLASLIGLVVLARSRPDSELLETVIAEALRRLV